MMAILKNNDYYNEEKKIEETILIIKPDSVENKKSGEIISFLESKGFEIFFIKWELISKENAKYFYIEHKKKPFFKELIEFITRSPIIIICLKGENVVKNVREIIGNNNPEKAEEGTIRKIYGKNILENSVHASDSIDSAKREKSIFFQNKLENLINERTNIINYFIETNIIDYFIDWWYPSKLKEEDNLHPWFFPAIFFYSMFLIGIFSSIPITLIYSYAVANDVANSRLYFVLPFLVYLISASIFYLYNLKIFWKKRKRIKEIDEEIGFWI